MNLEDFAKDCFEYVGNFIEVIINAYLRLIFQQVSIIKCNSKIFEDIKKLDLGVIIKSIINEKILKEIVNPSPWNIPLNQWRNIAQHYKYDINNDAILCKYGKFPKEKEIKILKIELWLLVNKLAKIQGVLKVAHHLFILDNKHKYGSLLPHQRKKLRKESKILDLFSTISLQGFHFVDYSKEQCSKCQELKLCVSLNFSESESPLFICRECYSVISRRLTRGLGYNPIGDKKGLDSLRYGITTLLSFDNINRLKEESLKNKIKN